MSKFVLTWNISYVFYDRCKLLHVIVSVRLLDFKDKHYSVDDESERKAMYECIYTY